MIQVNVCVEFTIPGTQDRITALHDVDLSEDSETHPIRRFTESLTLNPTKRLKNARIGANL